MYATKLVPQNFGLARRMFTNLRFGQVLHQAIRNLATNLLQDGVSSVIVPNSVYLDASYKCNRRCYGCYVEQGGSQMPRDLAEGICDSSYRMGVNYVTWMGGEPLLPGVKDMVLDVSDNFPKLSFNICTNGDYLDKDVADRVAAVNHVVPFISVDGTRDVHDSRRGNGSYDSTSRASRLLKDRRLIYGYLATIMPSNWECVTSEQFVGEMIDRGALLGGYTLFSPWKGNGRTLTSEEYAAGAQRLQSIAKNMPIYLITSDFGVMGHRIINGSKRNFGVTVSPSGEVKTERGGTPIGTVGNDGSFEDIIFDARTQGILRGKLEGTLTSCADERLRVLYEMSI